jgi:hypothetical protein
MKNEINIKTNVGIGLCPGLRVDPKGRKIGDYFNNILNLITIKHISACLCEKEMFS